MQKNNWEIRYVTVHAGCFVVSLVWSSPLPGVLKLPAVLIAPASRSYANGAAGTVPGQGAPFEPK